MRITNRMLTNNYQRNLNSTLSQMQEVNQQLASGKALSKPSQNPFLATRIMDYETEIARKEQFLRNIEDVEGYMNVTDAAMGQLNDQMVRLKELSVQASTGTYSAEERQIMAQEVEELIGSMVDTLNTSFDDKYIFAGMQTTTRPFELTKNADGSITVDYHGDEKIVEVEISKGVTIDRNITGSQVLGNVNGQNLFETLNEFLVALKNDDAATIASTGSDMGEHFDNILQMRGKVGATQARMEMAVDKANDEILSLTELLSQSEDVDWAAKLIEFKSLEAGYTATLQISSNILQPTLLNFLK